MTRYSTLGIPVDTRSLNDLVTAALAQPHQGAVARIFSCANPHSVMVAQEDAEFRSALLTSDYLVADGAGVTLVAKLVHGMDVPRITGTDFFLATMDRLQQQRCGRVFFFGSSNDVLGQIERRFRVDFPDLVFAGSLSPPFRDWSAAENDEMIARINLAKPDVLWIGMTAPKQEKWVRRNSDRLDVRLIGSIGAVFDFYAGTKPRAPGWMLRSGTEWLYRLIQEPRRLWRRNLVSMPLYLAAELRRMLDQRWA